MKAVIMAGGRGTRVASICHDIPKPMLPLCGKPVLERQIECLRAEGFCDIVLVIGYLGHVIKEYFADGRLHPNDMGMSVYAEQLLKMLAK